MTFLLVMLALILATNRRQVGNAKTLSELWEPARANGWGRGTALTVVGVVVFAFKFTGSVALVVLTVTAKAIEVLGFIASVVREHLTDLLNPPLPIGRVEAA
ncbi:hypothetical protein GCM10020220_056960 [Nonomuraea rubra]